MVGCFPNSQTLINNRVIKQLSDCHGCRTHFINPTLPYPLGSFPFNILNSGPVLMPSSSRAAVPFSLLLSIWDLLSQLV